MMVPFPMQLPAEATNEQLRSDAEAFMVGGDVIAQFAGATVGKGWIDHYRAARLFDYSREAYETAAARTIGHTKGEEYMRLEKQAAEKAAHHYFLAYRKADHMTPPEHVEQLWKRFGIV